MRLDTDSRFHDTICAMQLLTLRNIAATVGIFLITSSTAFATPLADKQKAARKLDAEVTKLEVRYDDLQERYRGAKFELDQIAKDVKIARGEVAATKRNLGVARNRLGGRASMIYREGSAGTKLADIALVGSFSRFFERIDIVQRISRQDATVLEEVAALKQRVDANEARLSKSLAKQKKVVARVDKNKQSMQKILSERQAKLNSVNAEIREIMAEQRRQAEARAAAAARESAALANMSGRSSATAPVTAAPDVANPSPSGSDAGVAVNIALPPASGAAAGAASAAMSKLGSPYQWAGSGPNTFDCSGLVMWAFAQAGRPGLPHSTYALVNMGVPVPLDQLQVGDLVFPSHNGHVGIYVGGGSFVHSPQTGDVVKVTSMSSYSISHARRL